MNCIDISKFIGIKQRGDYYCTFACIEMCLIYLNEKTITQEDLKSKFKPYFENDVPMFQTYEENFTKLFPRFEAVRFNDSDIKKLIKYIKEKIKNRIPVIQSRLTPQGDSHAILFLCYDKNKFKYHDPGPNKSNFIQIDDYEDFLGKYRGTLVLKRNI